MGKFLWRVSVVLHRYLGVLVGLMMAVWFLSGIVMMYVGYPGLSAKESLSVLEPFSWRACCAFAGAGLSDDSEIRGAQLEMIAGHPALLLREATDRERLFSLDTDGAPFVVDQASARAVALAAAPKIIGSAAPLMSADTIDRDQWTVSEEYDQHRPLFHFAFADPARTEIYVSDATGEVVLWTTGAQRFWNWFGAVPHWLYPTLLRQNPRLWTQIIVWAAVLATFLTAFGLVLGIGQFGRCARGGISPYRGWFYWHHVIGLVFGLFTLLFVFSGLVSMNPWGFLEGSGGGQDRVRLLGQPFAWRDVRAAIMTLQQNPPPSVVSIRTAPLGGKLYWLASRPDGAVTRLDASATPSPATLADLKNAAALLAGPRAIASQGIMAHEDEYYFAHHDEVVLPVYCVILKDAARYYIDPASAVPLKRVDGDDRAYRWLFAALHRWDFAAVLRMRPVWDVVMLTLLLGGFAGTVTGVYLAIRRVIRDLTPAR